MRVFDAQFEALRAGSILYDAKRMRNPSERLFTRDFWAERQALRQVDGGRGAICYVRPGECSARYSTGAGANETWVLRHYHRGGMAAKVLRDRYLWTGAEQTRCFREWRLLAELYGRGLPVPAPVAAKYARAGIAYRADIITVEVQASLTLAESITRGRLFEEQWNVIGRTIAQFHAHGVQHADLNAHNILVDAGAVYLLDFDRGRVCSRGAWEARVLARLKHSLKKISAQRSNVTFGIREWQWLMEGYGGRKEADGG